VKSARSYANPIASAFVFVGALAFYSFFSDYGFHREDEGALLLQFWRFASGETPWRDFHVGYTPGVYLVHKTLMQWMGPGLMPGRHLLALVNSASAAMLFVLAARLTSSWKWGLIAPLLYVCAVPVHVGDFAAFNIPYPAWYNLVFFALSAILLPGLAREATLPRILACGVLAGIGFTFKPNVGLFQLAASVLVFLQAYGRPRSAFEKGLWWTWWLATLGGLFVVFSSAQSAMELAGFLAPATIAGIAVARDAYRTPLRAERPALLSCALTMAGGFLAVCVPWLAWAYSILGPDWFARRALFLGAGFESVYYITGPPPGLSIAVVAAAAFAWFAPAWLDRRGWPAWPLPLIVVAMAVVAFATLATTRPMPEGVYPAVMKVVEPGVFSAATLVQWALLLLWLGRPATAQSNELYVPALVCGVMLYLQIFPRTDLMHWVSSAPLLFPSAVWLMQSLALRWSTNQGATIRRAVGTAIALPLVALALFRIGHFLDARLDVVNGRLVRTPETVLRIAHAPIAINAGRAETFRDLEATVDYVTAHSHADEPVFTFPALDYVSYFSLRRPGNRHGYYFPGWPGHDTEAEVLASLEKNPPPLAVMLYEPQLYFSSAATYYFLFGDFIESRYQRVRRFGPYATFAQAGTPVADDSALAAPGQATAIADALGGDRMSAILAALASPDAQVRRQAVQQMADWQILGDFEPLRRALSDPDASVRSAAVKAVPRTRSVAMRNALLDGVTSHAFSTTDSVLALRSANVDCDESCVPALLPLISGADHDTAVAARGVLGELPPLRWQSDFWWKWDGPPTEPFPEPTRSLLLSALRDPKADHEVRILAFAFADRLGLGPCPDELRSWSEMRSEQVGPDFTVCTAINHLSRAGCDGDWLDAALRWLPLDPTLSPRIVLREAHKDPQYTDAALAQQAGARLGRTSALAHWLCGMVGGPHCLAAARATLAGSPSEEERVAAAWAWSQLAGDQAAIDELLTVAGSDVSPQVRETARYGIERRRVRGQRAPGTS
jgi:hypothetical protein